METVLLYRCRDNDIVVEFYTVDDYIDELHIGVDGGSSQIVVGFDDIVRAITYAMSEMDIDFEKSLDDQNNSLNHNFRMIAKKRMAAKTYNKWAQEAQQARKKKDTPNA